MDFQDVLFENTLGIQGLLGSSYEYERYVDLFDFSNKSLIECNNMILMEASAQWDLGIAALNEEVDILNESFKDSMKTFLGKVKQAIKKIYTGFLNMLDKFLRIFKKKTNEKNPINKYEEDKSYKYTFYKYVKENNIGEIISTFHPQHKKKFVIRYDKIDRDMNKIFENVTALSKGRIELTINHIKYQNIDKDDYKVDDIAEDILGISDLTYDKLHSNYTTNHGIDDMDLKDILKNNANNITRIESIEKSIKNIINYQLEWCKEAEKMVDSKIEELKNERDDARLNYEKPEWKSMKDWRKERYEEKLNSPNIIKEKNIQRKIQQMTQQFLKNDRDLTTYCSIVCQLAKDEYVTASRILDDFNNWRTKKENEKKEDEK